MQGHMLGVMGGSNIMTIENSRQGRSNLPMTPDKSLTMLGKKVSVPSPVKPAYVLEALSCKA